jgi:hypothetical protein
LENISFFVAGVQFELDFSEAQQRFCLPDLYLNFQLQQTDLDRVPNLPLDLIHLGFANSLSSDVGPPSELIISGPPWSLYRNEKCQYIYHVPQPVPERWLVMEPEFNSGVISVEPEQNAEYSYPFDSLDILIFSNWLASRGDILLHAGGVAIDGKGYAFIGPSGAGKSTLVRDLACDSTVTVLGEDSLVLRQINGQFWLFGTPWHLDPHMCSPRGFPLEKIFFLERRGESTIKQISSHDSYVRIMQTAFIPFYRKDAVSLIMEKLLALCLTTPHFLLAYKFEKTIINSITEAARPL